jgi:acyl-CoA thioester hydrolase
MARIKLAIPQKFIFQTKLNIRITDLNYGGHVGNDSILTMIHEARMQFLQHAGYTELNMAGAGLIMADVAIEFKNELFYGDQLLVSVVAGDFSRIGFDIYYQMEKINEDKPILIAVAKTGMVCYDYNSKKVISVPKGVCEQLAVED